MRGRSEWLRGVARLLVVSVPPSIVHIGGSSTCTVPKVGSSSLVEVKVVE